MHNCETPPVSALLFQCLIGCSFDQCIMALGVMIALFVGGFTVVYSLTLPYGGFVLSRSLGAGEHDIASAEWIDVAWFALSLTTGLGHSFVEPATSTALFLANCQSLSVEVLLVCITGVVFMKVCRPCVPIRVSKRIIFGARDAFGRKALQTRFVISQPDLELIDTRIELVMWRLMERDDGFMMDKMYNLPVSNSYRPHLRVFSLVTHVIDEKSPLYKLTIDDLRSGKYRFSLCIFGMEKASMQPYFRRKYYPDEAIIDGCAYEDLTNNFVGGKIVLDHAKLDCVRSLRHKQIIE